MSGQEPAPKFIIRRVAEPTLQADLSNIAEISTAGLKQILARDGNQNVRQRLVTDMVQALASGIGVDDNALPEPLTQSGLECQTMALFNGVQAWRGRERVQPFLSRIPDIRERAIAHSGFFLDGSTDPDENAIYSMRAVGEVLEEEGLLQRHGVTANPIQFVRQLAHENRFLGVSKGDRFHAYTIIPLKGASSERFALSIDSLGGRQKQISANEFLDLLLDQKPLDYYAIYDAKSPSLPQISK